ncbi:MAG TPA: VWA domain-containing protein [Vicinamibacterales bacterium]|nr:VWA domain-containing protein [Vicinamibacterales bacterium]
MATPLVRALCLTILVGSLVRTAGGQTQQPGPPPPSFSSESELVVLQVTVFDRDGNSVRQLPREVFHVVEDGTPQTITMFSGEDAPVAVGLIVDNSSSMLTRRAMVTAGVTAFAQSSKPDDQAFSLVFNERVQRALPETVAFTSNPTLLQASIAAVPAGGQTALYDAVIAGLDQLDSAERQKHVLVVLSDGEDNASRQSERDMLKRADQSNALIYTVSTKRLDTSVGNERLLRKLARSTGGELYTPRTERDVVAAFAEIGSKIRQGYTIGYTPTNAAHDGTYRKLIVRVLAPGMRAPVVHVRDGYLAPLHQHGR